MTEIGETVQRVDTLIWETKTFQKLCDADIERAEEVVATGESIDSVEFGANKHAEFADLFFIFVRRRRQTGQQLISVRGACPKEVVQPKCDELSRVCDIVSERLTRRLETLLKSRDLMERVEKVRCMMRVMQSAEAKARQVKSPECMLHRSFRILVHFVGKQLVCQGCRTTRFAANRKVLDVSRLCRTKSSGSAAIYHVRQRVLQRIEPTRIPECVPREYNARDKGTRHTGKAIRHSLTSNFYI